MPPTRFSPIAVDLIAALAWVSMGIGTVWYVSLMRGVWTAAAFSPICGHADMAAVHCTPCYVALLLVFTGLVALPDRRARRAMPASREGL